MNGIVSEGSRVAVAPDPSSLYLAEPEYQLIKSRYSSTVETLAPGLGAASDAVLHQISSKNWALEWGLPRWMGEAYGLSDDTIQDLILANVYMLGFVRIVDDLIDDDIQLPDAPVEWLSRGREDEEVATAPDADGQTSPVSRERKILLSTLLHHLWLQQHLLLFTANNGTQNPVPGSQAACDSEMVYWREATLSHQQWILATSDEDRRAYSESSPFAEQDLVRTGHRGAVLKNGCVAACLLADRREEIFHVTTAINHILESAVLLDDVFDWAEDLQAHRFNAFVAFCSDLPQTAEFQDRINQSVLREIYLGGVIDRYFDVLMERLQKAQGMAWEVSIPKLDDFIVCLQIDIGTYQQMLKRATLSQMKQAFNDFINDSEKGGDPWKSVKNQPVKQP